MPSQPFQPTYSDCRTIEIPTGLDADDRKRFVSRVNEAVAQQIELSRGCDAVLKLTGNVREEGERLIVSHERAAPADPGAIVNDESRPDIETLWWLTWSTARALRAAGEKNVTHGGIQFACVYRDEAGRVKLGDFGVAQAFETVCGIDGRRYVACTCEPQADPSGRSLSGVWSLLDEQTGRDYGWIAPYFGHELLEAPLRLNPKSDQFALGTLLFLWATGYHPYDVDLSDPNQMILFQLEPRPLRDERPDWAAAFKRADTEVQTSADQVILSWRDLTNKLLASEPKERFASLGECVETVAKHADEKSWSAASEAISQATVLLDAGDVNGFLEKLSPYSEGDSLPALWHEHLAGYVQHAEAQKEVIARRKALERRLREGNEALERQELDTARAIAQEIRDAPDSDDEMRGSADALLSLCDEHEKLVRSGAAELARQNIEQAREAIGRNDLADARQFAEIVKQDPSAPEQLKTQAEELLTQIAEAEQLVSGYLAELTQATVERREGQLDSARERIHALLKDERLPESVATQARLLLKDLEAVERKYAGFTKTLIEAQAALERIDAAAAEALLEELPAKKLPEEMEARRGGLLEQLATLKRALDMRGSAEALLEKGEPDEARAAAAEALGVANIPAALHGELQALITRCESAVAEAEEAARERALAALKQAESRLEELNFDGCRELLTAAVLPFDGLPEDDRRRAEALESSCDAAASATAALDRTQAGIDAGDFEAAAAALSEAPTADLPAKLAARADELIAQIEKAREAFVKERRAELQSQIDQAAAAADSGEITQADELVRKAEQSPYLTDAMREAIGVVRGEIEKFRPVLDDIAAAESALEQGKLERARKLAAGLPRDIEWAASRAADLEKRVDEAEAAARHAALAAVEKALAAAESALIRVEPAAALKLIGEVGDDLSLDESLKGRAEAITAEAQKQQDWLPNVAALEQLAQRGELAKVYRDANALLKKEGMPKPIAKRVAAIADDAKNRIAARQEEIKSELAAVAADIEKRKRRASGVVARLGVISGDPLAAKVQKGQAEELLKQFEALPVPKPPLVPIGIGVGVLGVAAVIVFMMTRPSPPTTPTTPPVTTATDAQPLEEALLKLTQQAMDAAVGAHGRRPKPFTLRFEERDGISNMLVVQFDGEDSVDLGGSSEEDIARGALTAEQLEAWLRATEPPPPLPPDLPAIKRRIEDAARAEHGARYRKFKLELADGQSPASELFLIVEDMDAQSLGRLSAGVLARAGVNNAVDYLKPTGKPTQREVDVFNEAVIGVLDDSGVTFEPIMIDALKLQARYRQQSLDSLSMTYDQDRFSRKAVEVARHFVIQAEALARLARPGAVSVTLGGSFGAYQNDVRFVEVARTAVPTGVDADAGSVSLDVSARLTSDPGDGEPFMLSGVLDDGVLTANDAGRTAFGEYLDTLKKNAADRRGQVAPTGIGEWEFPAGITTGDARHVGDAVEFDLKGQALGGSATLKYTWRRAGLEFKLDEEAAASAVREWIQRLIVADRLKSSWTKLRDQVAPPTGAAGAAYVRATELVNVSPAAGRPVDSPFSLSVDLVVGPVVRDPSDVRRNLQLPWRVNVEAGGLVFDAATANDARSEIEQRVKDKADEAGFRRARAEDAVKALKPTPDSFNIDPSKTPNILQATVTWDEQAKRYGWIWDDGKMGFVDGALIEAGLAAMLSELASKTAPIEPEEFVDALSRVTEDKSASYGGRYLPNLPADNVAATDALIEISQTMQSQITGNKPAEYPFPLVFVEYFVQDGEGFALGWIGGISNQNEQIDSVEEMRVWRIAQLPEANEQGEYDARGMQAYYESYTAGPAVGNDLLSIIPDDIKASPNGTWGVVVAPSGPLWAVRWSEVQFDVRTINPDQKIEWLDPPASTPNPPVTTLDHLGEVLAEKARLRNQRPTHRRAGIWSVPCLAGTFPQLRGMKTITLEGLTDFELSWINLPPMRGSRFPVLLLTLPGRNGNYDATRWTKLIKDLPGGQVHKNLFGQQFWRIEQAKDMGVWNVGTIQGRKP